VAGKQSLGAQTRRRGLQVEECISEKPKRCVAIRFVESSRADALYLLRVNVGISKRMVPGRPHHCCLIAIEGDQQHRSYSATNTSLPNGTETRNARFCRRACYQYFKRTGAVAEEQSLRA